MIKFIRVQKIEKGTITHDDQEKDNIKFEILASDIIKIDGENKKVLNLIERSRGVEISEDIVNIEIEKYRIDGINERVKELEKELLLLKELK